MPFANRIEPAEARAVVRAAAGLVRNRAARAWLFDDPHGSWEKQAREMLLDEKVQTRAACLGIVDDAGLREAVSNHVAWLALTALLNTVKENHAAR